MKLKVFGCITDVGPICMLLTKITRVCSPDSWTSISDRFWVPHPIPSVPSEPMHMCRKWNRRFYIDINNLFSSSFLLLCMCLCDWLCHSSLLFLSVSVFSRVMFGVLNQSIDSLILPMTGTKIHNSKKSQTSIWRTCTCCLSFGLCIQLPYLHTLN